jgi:hypothetical protein
MSRLWHILQAVAMWSVFKLADFVVRDGYDRWAPHLAGRVIRAAALLLPRLECDRYREEWLAELEEAERQGGAIAFALFEVLPAALVLAARLLRRCPIWRPAGRLGFTYGAGVGVSAVGAGLGAWLGAISTSSQLGVVFGLALGICPGLWLAAVLGDRGDRGDQLTSWRSIEHCAQLGAVLGFWLGAAYGMRGSELAVLAGVGLGPMLGGELSAWAAAALVAWTSGDGRRSAALTHAVHS